MQNHGYRREIERSVFVRRIISSEYPKESPYAPQEDYPENPFPGEFSSYNPVYEAVRNLLYDMGFDSKHFGTRNWNPLGWLIHPGQTVLLKPNWVQHPRGEVNVDSLLTHGSIIRAVLDYVYITLEGNGIIVVADAPIQFADWDKICCSVGIPSLIGFYNERGIKIHLVDLRQQEVILDRFGVPCYKKKLSGDPFGYAVVNL